ncbi:hypothetical protein PG989_014758 [Apiospora arundinis]
MGFSSDCPSSDTALVETRTERFGLLPVGDPVAAAPGQQQFDVDIVAVHGLNGDAYTTWTHSNGTFWLRDLLPASLPGCRVFSYGYPSQFAFSSSLATVRDYSRRLLGSIQSVHDALVIAQEDNKQYGPILETMSGVVFLGTPHRGSKAADLGAVIGTIINICSLSTPIRTDLLRNLKYDSAALQQLTTSVRQRLADIEVVTFYETAPTPGLGRLVVDESSSCMGIPHEVLLPLFDNHRDMCRFAGETDSYKLVLYQIREMSLKGLTPLQSKERTDTISSTRSLTETEKSCVTLFSVYDVADYRMSLPRPAKGTFKWILSHPLFASWRNATRSALLWLTGHAGCGKTILSSFLMDQLRQAQVDDSKRCSICIYFCDDNINKQKDGRAVLLGLIFQILSMHRSLIRYAKKAFELQGSNLVHSFAALWQVFQSIVSDPRAGSVYIIIDALDECEPTTRRELLTSIDDMILSPDGTSASSERTIKFILSSRPYFAGSERPLGRLSDHRLSIDEAGDAYAADLDTYIRQRMSEISEVHKLSPETKQYLQDALLAKADRTFLWVHMVLSSFENLIPISPKDFRRLIDEIPADLQATYRGLLNSIPKESQAIASKLLSLVLGSSRPLDIDEINIALTLNAEHRDEEELKTDLYPHMVRTLQVVLGPLVRISESKVSLIHQSAKEFLMRYNNSAGEGVTHWFTATQEEIALSVAEVCIQYLTLDDFSTDIFTVDESSSDDLGDMADSSDKSSEDCVQPMDFALGIDDLFMDPEALVDGHCGTISQKHHFYKYASLNWAHHFAKCQAIAPSSLKRSAAVLLKADDSFVSSNWLKYFWTKSGESNAAVPSNPNEVELAAYFGFDKMLEDYLQEGISISQWSLNTALYWAATNNHINAVQVLLSAGADPNAHAYKRQTPLIGAAVIGSSDCVRILLGEQGINVNLTDQHGRSALLLACRYGHFDVVKLLLDSESCEPDKVDNIGATPLLWAAGGGYARILSELMTKSGVEVNHQDNSGRTAISWAAGDGLRECVEVLLRHKRVDINLSDKKGRSPLMWAAHKGHVETIRLLVRRRNLDRNAVDLDRRSALSWACGDGHADAVKWLVRSGCTGINQRDIDGWSPLLWTILRDSPDTVRAILSTGLVDIEERDPKGKTVLYWAVSYSNIRAVEALLENNADPEAKDDDGKTVMTFARENGHSKIINALSAALNRRLAGN